jgi:hypothetical protein
MAHRRDVCGGGPRSTIYVMLGSGRGRLAGEKWWGEELIKYPVNFSYEAIFVNTESVYCLVGNSMVLYR